MITELNKKGHSDVRFMVLYLLLVVPILTTANLLRLETFGQELFNRLSVSHPAENQLLSPFPVATLLILLRMNAGNATGFEIEDQLGLTGLTLNAITMNYKELFERFDRNNFVTMSNHIAIMKNDRNVETIHLNVEETINAWSEFDICGKSAEFSPDGQGIQLMLSTEAHFQNIFRYIFSPSISRYFIASDGERTGVEMFKLVASLEYGEIPVLDTRAIKVPYGGGDISLVILLPNSRYFMDTLETNLKSFPLKSIDSYLSRNWVTLLLPRSNIEVQTSLKDGLESLGISSMFNRMCDTMPEVKVLDIIHKATFEINEKNTGNNPCADSDLANFTKMQEIELNHPFFFIIKSHMNDVYLMGKIVK